MGLPKNYEKEGRGNGTWLLHTQCVHIRDTKGKRQYYSVPYAVAIAWWVRGIHRGTAFVTFYAYKSN